MGELIRNHGWHVIMELALLLLTTVVTVAYGIALFRGRVRSIECPSCGRIASTADPHCPRCRSPLQPA